VRESVPVATSTEVLQDARLFPTLRGVHSARPVPHRTPHSCTPIGHQSPILVGVGAVKLLRTSASNHIQLAPDLAPDRHRPFAWLAR
jgi:hypothetical protein